MKPPTPRGLVEWGRRGIDCPRGDCLLPGRHGGDDAGVRFGDAAGVPRVALVDFNNDCVGDTLRVMAALFARWMQLTDGGRLEEAQRFKLAAVRPDTSASLRDVSVPPLGDRRLDSGVNARLVFTLREAIDNAWQAWNLPRKWHSRAQKWCRDVRIIVTGGFKPEKIREFEELGVPVDIYGVGSYILSSCDRHGTNNDYTADVVRVQVDGEWHEMAKVGRAPRNPLEPVSAAARERARTDSRTRLRLLPDSVKGKTPKDRSRRGLPLLITGALLGGSPSRGGGPLPRDPRPPRRHSRVRFGSRTCAPPERLGHQVIEAP